LTVLAGKREIQSCMGKEEQKEGEKCPGRQPAKACETVNPNVKESSRRTFVPAYARQKVKNSLRSSAEKREGLSLLAAVQRPLRDVRE